MPNADAGTSSKPTTVSKPRAFSSQCLTEDALSRPHMLNVQSYYNVRFAFNVELPYFPFFSLQLSKNFKNVENRGILVGAILEFEVILNPVVYWEVVSLMFYL